MSLLKEKKYIVALDQGTTGSRTIVLDQDAKVISQAQRESKQIYSKEGWVEQDPLDIFASQSATLIEALASKNISTEEVAAIGITNQRETTIIWDKNTGQPVYNAIVWQCRRTADYCADLKKDGEFEEYIRKNTGLLIDPYFSATKIRWILDHVKGTQERAEKGELLFGTVDTWLIWKLTQGVHVTDYTNASRTMLLNIHSFDWDDFLLKKFNIPRKMMPILKKSSDSFGDVNLGGKGGTRIPITGVAGDQQAALFGHLCVHKGMAKNTYGTGCFMLLNTGETPIYSKNNLLTTLCCGSKGEPNYALEGSVFVAGAAVQWLRDELKFVTEAFDTEYFAKKVPDTGGVYLVPAFTGLGAPHWNPYVRGALLGITRGTNRSHIIRATLESIAYQVRDVIESMEQDTQIQIKALSVDGAASENNFLMQFQSDILNIEVFRPQELETTGIGVSYLAGLSIGFWKDIEDIKSKFRIEEKFIPEMEESERQEKYNGWKIAIRQIISHY